MPHSFRRPVAMGLMIAIACVAATSVLASFGGSLPWEGPLQTIQESITGSVAGFLALAAVAVAGGMLIFGGELNDFARHLMYVVLVSGVLLDATQIVGLFGTSGALRGIPAQTADVNRAGESSDG